MAAAPGTIHIGAAGYNYAHWRKGVVYPKGLPQQDELKYYSSLVPTCEINSTFYGLPRIQACTNWHNAVPDKFVFTLKLSKSITHESRLQDVDDAWQAFVSNATTGLSNKLGPILIQLPPSLHRDDARLAALTAMIEDTTPDARVAIEFRSPSWFCDQVYAKLRAHNWALVEGVSPDGAVSVPPAGVRTADWTYARWHGALQPDGGHSMNYSDATLRAAAVTMAARAREGVRSQFLFFLNDVHGHAITNAKTLISMVQEELGVASLVPGYVPPSLATAPRIDTFFKKRKAGEEEEERERAAATTAATGGGGSSSGGGAGPAKKHASEAAVAGATGGGAKQAEHKAKTPAKGAAAVCGTTGSAKKGGSKGGGAPDAQQPSIKAFFAKKA